MMKTMKYIISMMLVCWFGTISNQIDAQASHILLSNLIVTDHMTGGPEIIKIAIRFDVSDINSLSVIQVETSETQNYNNAPLRLEVIHKDGVHYIKYGKDNTLPVSGKPTVIFFLDVPDQLTTPYHFIRVTGFDNTGLKTNSVEFNKK